MSNEGNFELGKAGWYTVQTAVYNDFLNEKLKTDEYGKWYSVAFAGDAETFLWMTKTEPIQGEKYWGWLEKTSSGKAVKFKWDKKNAPATLPDGTPAQEGFKRDISGVPVDMIKALLPYFDVQSLKAGSHQYRTLMELAQNLTEDALTMVEAIRNGEKMKEIDEVPDEITLDDLEG